MKVRLLEHVYPDAPGAIVEKSEAKGQSLIEAGFAVQVADDTPVTEKVADEVPVADDEPASESDGEPETPQDKPKGKKVK